MFYGEHMVSGEDGKQEAKLYIILSGENMSWRVVCTQSRREGLERGIHKSLHWPMAEMSAVLAISLDKAQVYKEDALSSYYLEHNV